MSSNDKAPAWRVVTISNYNGDQKWCIHEGDRLVMWTGKEADARRIVEAVNGAGELRALVAEAQRDAAEADGRMGKAIRERDAAAWAHENSARDRQRLAGECERYKTERDELRAEVERLRATAPQVERTPDAPSTLAALNEAAARLTATIERHEVLLGIGPTKPDDEIAKLRRLALAVADWLEAEKDRPLGCGKCEEAYRVWDEAQIAVAPALGIRRPDWVSTNAALRALAGGVR